MREESGERLVRHIGGNAVEDHVSVRKLSHHGERRARSVRQLRDFVRIAIAARRAVVLIRKAVADHTFLHRHQGQSAVYDIALGNRTSEPRCHGSTNLRRYDHGRKASLGVKLRTIGIVEIQTQIAMLFKSDLACHFRLPEAGDQSDSRAVCVSPFRKRTNGRQFVIERNGRKSNADVLICTQAVRVCDILIQREKDTVKITDRLFRQRIVKGEIRALFLAVYASRSAGKLTVEFRIGRNFADQLFIQLFAKRATKRVHRGDRNIDLLRFDRHRFRRKGSSAEFFQIFCKSVLACRRFLRGNTKIARYLRTEGFAFSLDRSAKHRRGVFTEFRRHGERHFRELVFHVLSAFGYRSRRLLIRIRADTKHTL